MKDRQLKTISLSQCELLNRYYDERALSQLPTLTDTPYFQFGKVVWGYDLIEMVDGKASCLPIPLDKASIANTFHESTAHYAYLNGNIVISANIPAGTFPEGENYEFSCLGIEDNSGGLVLVAVTQPLWVYSDRGVMIEIVVKTARSDSMVKVR